MSKKTNKHTPLIMEHEEVRSAWAKPIMPGLHVQRTLVEGVLDYNVVRVVFCDRGHGLDYHVLDEGSKEKYSPIIVCHSEYQKIEE